MADEIKTLVIDNGSSLTKAGYAGDEAPYSIFPTIVGHDILTTLKKTYVGDECLLKPTLDCSYPVERGIITNWNDIEDLLHHTFYNGLRVDPSEHQVLLTEVPLNPKENREKITEIMFEKFNVQSFYLANQAVLSLYSAGCTTGIVFESGAEVSNIVPIKDGHAIIQETNNFKLAGKDLTFWIKKLLPKSFMPVSAVTPSTFANYFEDIKLKYTYVAQDYENELKKAKSTSECNASFKTPDGDVKTLSDVRFTCPELLFKPQLNGLNFNGIDKEIFDRIMKCDNNIHNDLFAHIVLSGGNTMFLDFPERIEKDITKLAPQGTNVKVIALPNRKYGAWLGGSTIASLDNFNQMCITHDEYNQNGAGIVNSKCT